MDKDDVAFYRQEAQRARQLAIEATDEEKRARYDAIAMQYERLAETLEQLLEGP